MRRLLLLALAAATAAHAQRPTIDISGARVQAYPIALAPPSGAPEGADVMEVLAADFDRSGLFRLLDPRSFLADPAKEGSSANTIDFSKWTAVGAQALVKAAAKVDGEVVKVEFRLFDVPTPRSSCAASTARRERPCGRSRTGSATTWSAPSPRSRACSRRASPTCGRPRTASRSWWRTGTATGRNR